MAILYKRFADGEIRAQQQTDMNSASKVSEKTAVVADF